VRPLVRLNPQMLGVEIEKHQTPSAVLRLLEAPRSLTSSARFRVPVVRRLRDLPGSWVTLAYAPCASTPTRSASRGPGRAALCFGLQMLPSTRSRVSALVTSFFRGSTTRLAGLLSTLRSRPHGRTTQDSLSAGGLLLGRTGLSPVGHSERFQLLHSFSFPRLVLAH
jgi:hypothetical protein